MERIHSLTPNEVYQVLRTSPEGLNENEAAERLLHFGPNLLEVQKNPQTLKNSLHNLAISSPCFYGLQQVLALLVIILTQKKAWTNWDLQL